MNRVIYLQKFPGLQKILNPWYNSKVRKLFRKIVFAEPSWRRLQAHQFELHSHDKNAKRFIAAYLLDNWQTHIENFVKFIWFYLTILKKLIRFCFVLSKLFCITYSFHSILVTWFLGNDVTKIRKYYVIFCLSISILQGKTGIKEINNWKTSHKKSRN